MRDGRQMVFTGVKRGLIDEREQVKSGILHWVRLVLVKPQGKSYMEKHKLACEWARRNRDLIGLRFLACLEPGNSD